jgi:hypothetical protein
MPTIVRRSTRLRPTVEGGRPWTLKPPEPDPRQACPSNQGSEPRDASMTHGTPWPTSSPDEKGLKERKGLGAAEHPAEFSVEDLEPDSYTCTIFIDP